MLEGEVVAAGRRYVQRLLAPVVVQFHDVAFVVVDRDTFLRTFHLLGQQVDPHVVSVQYEFDELVPDGVGKSEVFTDGVHESLAEEGLVAVVRQQDPVLAPCRVAAAMYLAVGCDILRLAGNIDVSDVASDRHLLVGRNSDAVLRLYAENRDAVCVLDHRSIL